MIFNPNVMAAAGGGLKGAVGSYVGTGVYNVANKNTLKFDFKPLVLFVTNPDTSSNQRAVTWIRGMAAGDNGYNGRTMVLEWGEHAVSWYSTTTGINGPAYLQLNGSGVTYNYIAIGE